MEKDLYSSPWSRITRALAANLPNLRNQMNEQFQEHLKSLESLELSDKIRRLQKLIAEGNKLERYYVLRICTPNEELRKKDVIELNRMYKDWLQELKEQPANETTMELPEGMTIAAIAIMHVYWGLVDQSKRLSKNNIQNYVKEYGKGENTLLREYRKYLDLDNRMNVTASKRAVSEHLSRYESFLPVLETACPDAFDKANRHFSELKLKYSRFL